MELTEELRVELLQSNLTARRGDNKFARNFNEGTWFLFHICNWYNIDMSNVINEGVQYYHAIISENYFDHHS